MSLFNFGKKKTPENTPSPAEQYLDYLNAIFQQEPRLFREESMIEGLPGVTCIMYENIPEPGCITAFTYGLSLANHPDWKLGRPELCISVESDNLAWGRVVGFLANQLRGECPFSYGEIINFREKISTDSDMDAFFVFAPSLLDREDYTNIEIGAGYKINISGIYPMYAGEVEVYKQMGLEKFWHHPDFDPFSINRKQITL
ncbi:MAG: suppressor of fused domain protein [Lewinellaceae bacterium]|nr:suppressor of fused domain protein [Lewinellaceae bacterium]